MDGVTGSPAIDVDQAANAPADTILVDVREHREWVAGHAPSARHLPMSEISNRVDELPRDRRIVCICRSGNRSGQVTAWLISQGFNAVNMTGGMQQWVSLGHPLVDHTGSPGAVI